MLVEIEDSDVQAAVSRGSPKQASAEGALEQWRSRNLFPHEQAESQVDQCPQSDQDAPPVCGQEAL